MAVNRLTQDGLTFKPLTPHEWPDFEKLFEEHGSSMKGGNDDPRCPCR